MNQTVSHNASNHYYSVLPESTWQLLRWIHFAMPVAEFAALVADIEPRISGGSTVAPMELVEDSTRVAAAYFIQLEGSVATLGGVRAKVGREMQAGKLIDLYLRQMQATGIAQVQALVDANDVAAKLAMLNSSFRQVTTVKHLVFDLSLSRFNPNLSRLSSTFQLRPACEFPRDCVDQLVAETFEATLDCPDLDGVRSSAEVVGGFLESKPWDENLPWWVLCKGSTPVGCSFVNPHPKSVFELAYVGLVPAVRGQGLGRVLVEAAIADCSSRGGEYLATAVDTQNWPAQEIYRSLCFSELRELGVWLPKVAKSQQAAA